MQRFFTILLVAFGSIIGFLSIFWLALLWLANESYAREIPRYPGASVLSFRDAYKAHPQAPWIGGPFCSRDPPCHEITTTSDSLEKVQNFLQIKFQQDHWGGVPNGLARPAGQPPAAQFEMNYGKGATSVRIWGYREPNGSTTIVTTYEED